MTSRYPLCHFSSPVDSSKIVSLASAVEMSPTLYMEQTARALTGRGGAGQDNFVYQAHIGPTGSLEVRTMSNPHTVYFLQ